METFDFPNHEVRHKYPDPTTIKFGGGYDYGVEPLEPEQRRFTLTFASIRWVKNAAGVYVNNVDLPNNALRLDEFYRAHKGWKRFIYPHELFGNLTVRFAQGFETPKAAKGGSGWTESFDIVLTEQP